MSDVHGRRRTRRRVHVDIGVKLSMRSIKSPGSSSNMYFSFPNTQKRCAYHITKVAKELAHTARGFLSHQPSDRARFYSRDASLVFGVVRRMPAGTDGTLATLAGFGASPSHGIRSRNVGLPDAATSKVASDTRPVGAQDSSEHA